MKLRKILATCLTVVAASSVFAAQPITIKVGDNWNNTHPMAAAMDSQANRLRDGEDIAGLSQSSSDVQKRPVGGIGEDGGKLWLQ